MDTEHLPTNDTNDFHADQLWTRGISLLVVSLSYWPALGGSEVEAQRVCAGLIRRGHPIQVICGALNPMPEQREWVDPYNVPVRIVGRGFSGRWLDLAFALSVGRTLLRERERYDLIYFLMPGLHLAVGLPVARLLGLPVVMKFACSGHISTVRTSLLGRLELRMLRNWARRVMVLNDGMTHEALAAGLRPKQLLWMPNPVDAQIFKPCLQAEKRDIRANLGLAPDSLVVVFAGRLAPEKELQTLIRAFARVRSGFPNAVLVLIGEGTQRKKLEMCAAREKLTAAVRFTGRLDMPVLLHWLQGSDIFVLVSSKEGFSCSLIEAMACGLPSVVTDIPGNLQLITAGVDGLVANQGDVESVSSALLHLLKDPVLRLRLGTAARRHVMELCSTDKILDRYEVLFKEASRARSASAGNRESVSRQR